MCQALIPTLAHLSCIYHREEEADGSRWDKETKEESGKDANLTRARVRWSRDHVVRIALESRFGWQRPYTTDNTPKCHIGYQPSRVESPYRPL